MLSQRMQDALNKQIEHEFYSSFVYLSMSAHFESRNLPGFAKWMRMQAGEEHAHAMKIFDHILDRGGAVAVPALASPPAKFEAPLSVFEQALHHERAVTKSIHDLYDLAVQERDYPARVFLGDAGSVPLGFVAAALGLAGMVREIWPIWFPLLVFSPFVVDSTTTLFRRLLRGEKVWQAHHEHYYQRMVRSGIGHRDTALIWYAVMLASGLSACMALALPRTGQLAVLGGWAVFYAMAGAAVERRWSAYLSSVRDDRDGE